MTTLTAFSMIISFLLIISSFLLYKQDKKITDISNELIKQTWELYKEKSKEKKILFGIITKPSEVDYQSLQKNIDILDVVIKILHYEIFKTTDITRWRQEQTDSNIQRNIWALNQLHELNLLFTKIKQWLKITEEDEEY